MKRRSAIWIGGIGLLSSCAVVGCNGNEAPVKPIATNQSASPSETVPVNKLTGTNTVITDVEVEQGKEVSAPRVIEVKSLKDINGVKAEVTVSQGKDGLIAKVVSGEEYIGIMVSAAKDAKPGVQELTIKAGNSTDTLRVTVKAAAAK